jgi:hypothetical protein
MALEEPENAGCRQATALQETTARRRREAWDSDDLDAC